MSRRLNPPPGWPPVPEGWTPPPGWQPNPAWPDPPPGWVLWIEDPATRAWQVRAAIWAITGGALVFIGSLFPFLHSADPYMYAVTSTPAEMARFYGVVLVGLGVGMLARQRPPRLICGILALIFVGFAFLTLAGFIAAGFVGNDPSNLYGATSDATYYPSVGIIFAILGCLPVAVGAIMSFQRR